MTNIGTLMSHHSFCDCTKSEIICRLKIISFLQEMEKKNPNSSLLSELLKDQKAVEEIKKIRIIC